MVMLVNSDFKSMPHLKNGIYLTPIKFEVMHVKHGMKPTPI